MSLILGLDPGPERSAIVGFDGSSVVSSAVGSNQEMMDILTDPSLRNWTLVIERVVSFGMPVGVEVFETVFWSGRFAQAWPYAWDRLERRIIKQHICHTARATDANIRQALIDRFGGQERAIGKKASPGPLYGLKGHLWAAFSVAITWHDQHADQPQEIRPGVSPDF